jgi:RNA polymerase sigma-70 factor, ECF subfamily
MFYIPGALGAPFQDMCADVAMIERCLRMFFRSNGSTSEADMLSEHIDGLFSYALALSRNRVDAEDLVLETYVRAIPAVRGVRRESHVKSWMFTILRNIWLNQLRQRRVQFPGTDIDQILPAFHAASTKDAEAPLLVSVDQEQVRQAILRLPVESREIILLREFEDLSYQEIAGVLKCPIGTVLSRLGKARSKLRALLSSTLGGQQFR